MNGDVIEIDEGEGVLPTVPVPTREQTRNKSNACDPFAIH